MANINWEIVARAVCNMEALGQGLKDKQLDKYVSNNWHQRVSGLQRSYQLWQQRQKSPALTDPHS